MATPLSPPPPLASLLPRMAGASTTSLLLAPPRPSCQIAGRPTSSPSNLPGRLPVPAPTIRPRRRFAAARCDVDLVPAWQLRVPPRRRNVLREKASPAPLLVEHQVRPPNHEALDSHYQLNKDRPLAGATGEPQSDPLDGQSPPNLGDRLANLECLDPSRSGSVAPESNLDGDKGLDWDAEEGHLYGTGTRPVFSVYEDSDGNAVRVEVNEGEIVGRCGTAGGEGSGDLQSMLSRARVMAREFESGEREVPRNNTSLVRFVAIEKKKSCVVDAEVSVVQRNGAPLRAVAWSGFATVCGICVVFIASKFIWRNVKAQLSENVFCIPLPWMKADQLDNGNINVISNVYMFPGDLMGRPQLGRSQLMNNLKKARESRERFSFRNIFRFKTVANENDASMIGIRRMVTDVHTLEEGCLSQINAGNNSSVVFPHSVVAGNERRDSSVVFPHPVVAIEEEISATSVSQSVYHDDVSELDSSGLRDINLSTDIIDESAWQSVDLKNAASTTDSIVKSQYDVGEIEQPEPRYIYESTADAKGRTSVLYATEKAHIYSGDDHNAGPNGIDTLSAEFERKEQYTEIAVSTQGLKPSLSFSSDKQMVYKNDSAPQIRNNVIPETADDFSPNCVNVASSELKYNGAYLANGGNDVNCMQEVEAPTAFANDAKTANCEGFSHCVSIKSKEACGNLVMTNISTMNSPQRIREEHVDLMSDNMEEPAPSNHDGKKTNYANEDHKIDILQKEIMASSEAYSIETFDKASTSPLYSLQEEAVQHKDSKVSKPEKQERITSSNIEARAYLKKDKGKLQKEMCSDKVPEIKLLAEGALGTSIVVGPSNDVQKTKRVANKRLKNLQSNQRIAEQDIVHNSSMIDQESSNQNVKRTRTKNQTNAFRTQGSRTREEIPETILVASLPGDASKDENTKPVGEAGSSAGTPFSKLAMSGSNVPDPDIFGESQPSSLIARTMRKDELKLDFQTSERVEAAAPGTKTNMHGYSVMHERSTDVNKSKTKMGVPAAKKSTKRKSLTKRTKPSNPMSNKDSEEPTDD